MASPPPAIKRALAELDAGVDAMLPKWKLPGWIALYRLPNLHGGEARRTLFRRGRYLELARRGIVPRMEGIKPTVSGFINSVDDFDVSARHVLRYRLAVQHRHANKPVLDYLLAHPPSTHPGAGNLSIVTANRDAVRQAAWARWQAEADLLWKQYPSLSASAVAGRIKTRLKLKEAVGTIRKRIKKQSWRDA
ncbi:hypothetical protein [Bradyrhizobium sp. McL0616]|uniref:hypothetical protein n=1 Tax=Bradyrhizobium sp. McL0616 TaxID=3415674 RepID=UPI003CF3788B